MGSEPLAILSASTMGILKIPSLVPADKLLLLRRDYGTGVTGEALVIGVLDGKEVSIPIDTGIRGAGRALSLSAEQINLQKERYDKSSEKNEGQGGGTVGTRYRDHILQSSLHFSSCVSSRLHRDLI